MVRLILFGVFFVILTNKSQLDAAGELYGQTTGRIRASTLNINKFNSQPVKPLSKLSRLRRISPSFMQSRHYHVDQRARDNRDLGQPSSFTTPISSSYYYSYGGPGTHLTASSQEACRLTNSYCSRDYQCCSGKCRCVRWSIMGKMSCLKKCF